MREQEFTTEKTYIAIHDKYVRCYESRIDPAIDPAMAGEVGKVGALSLPLGMEWGKGYAFGVPPTLSRCSPLDGGTLRCLALCAYSVSFRGAS